MKDKIQITLAVLLAIAGLAAFYWLSDKPMIARVGAMFAGFITTTRNGRGLLFHITSAEAASTQAPAATV